MITNREIETITKIPKMMRDVLIYEGNRSTYYIESVYQRPYVWSYGNINDFWIEFVKCVQNCISTSEVGYGGNKFYQYRTDLGTMKVSTLESCNIPSLKDNYNKERCKSVVDGSQRLRTSLFCLCAIQYSLSKDSSEQYINLQSLKKDEIYKLSELGDSELSDFYKYIENTPIDEISLMCDKTSIERLSKKLCKENQKRNYIDIFTLFILLIERDIFHNYDLWEVRKIFLEQCYIYEESVITEEKFDCFVDMNKKGTPMSDEDMYPKYIINQLNDDEKNNVKEIYDKFISEITLAEENGRIRPTKAGHSPQLFVMTEVLKLKLGEECKKGKNIDTKKVFLSSFNLRDINYGIEKCIRNGYCLNTIESAYSYFEKCYQMAYFLNEISFKKFDTIEEGFYYFRDFSSKDMIWWYMIKPLFYVYSSIQETNNELAKYIKGALFRLYTLYIVQSYNNTNSQNLINLIENITSIMSTFVGGNEEFKTNVNEMISQFVEKRGGYSIVERNIQTATYESKKGKSVIDIVLTALEYDFTLKTDCEYDAFQKMWFNRKKNKYYHLEHWLPQRIIKEKYSEDSSICESIGNFYLLEVPLNCSKQDRNDDNAHNYAQSRFNQTRYSIKGHRGIQFNNGLETINSYPYILILDEDEINNPSIKLIKKRRDLFCDFFIHFIKDFIENNE